MLKFVDKLPPCLVGIEECASAHYWGLEIGALGHQVRLMPPAYVKPYVKRGKADAADVDAICDAVTRPTMRFVAVKSEEQHANLMLHKTRNALAGGQHQEGMGQLGEQRLVKVFVARATFEALDEAIMHLLARSDVMLLDPSLLRPAQDS